MTDEICQGSFFMHNTQFYTAGYFFEKYMLLLLTYILNYAIIKALQNMIMIISILNASVIFLSDHLSKKLQRKQADFAVVFTD